MDYSNQRYGRFYFLLNLKLLELATFLLRGIGLGAFTVTSRIAAGLFYNRRLEELRARNAAAP